MERLRRRSRTTLGRPVRVRSRSAARSGPPLRAGRAGAQRTPEASRGSIYADPFVREVIENFGAEIDPASIRPRADAQRDRPTNTGNQQPRATMMKGQLAGLMQQAQKMQESMQAHAGRTRQHRSRGSVRRRHGQGGDDLQARGAPCHDRSSLVGDDKDMLEDLVAAAFNDAARRAEETATQEKMAVGHRRHADAAGLQTAVLALGDAAMRRGNARSTARRDRDLSADETRTYTRQAGRCAEASAGHRSAFGAAHRLPSAAARPRRRDGVSGRRCCGRATASGIARAATR